MSQHAWYEHFKEKLQGLTESFEQSGTPLSLLAYALKENYLSQEDYLAWAMPHHALPILQSRFFTETPVSQEMFARWATHYPWSTECLPVAEWDGSLIVACLQPPQDFPSNPSFAVVLAKPEDLVAAWAHLHPEKNVQVEAAPEGIDLSLVATAKKTASDSFSFDDLGVAEEPAPALESSESIEVEEIALDGIFDSPTVVKLESTSIAKTETAAVTLEPLDLPESLPVAESDTHESKTVVAPLTAAAPALENSEFTASGKKSVPPPPPPKSELPPPFEDSFSNKVLPITPRPAGVAKPTFNPVANGQFALDKYKKKNQALLNEKIKKALSEMKAHFDKSMILTLDEQETQLTAFAWDENFKDLKDTSARFPLRTPSIFNVVVETQKPYHGYISLNETNEKFFDSWNAGKIPDHVTIAPILINDKIVGMVMGFAEKSAYNKVSLNSAEKIITEFIKGLAA